MRSGLVALGVARSNLKGSLVKYQIQFAAALLRENGEQKISKRACICIPMYANK